MHAASERKERMYIGVKIAVQEVGSIDSTFTTTSTSVMKSGIWSIEVSSMAMR